MIKVEIPIVDGKYKASFPPKCVYCGASQAVTLRKTISAGNSRRRRFATMDVPYCTKHARNSKRNARMLTAVLITILLFSCSLLFGVTTSINRNPSTGLLIFLALIAVGLAYGGRALLRKMLARSRPTMADMMGGNLGFQAQLVGGKVVFSFVNGRIAAEFAQLNENRSNSLEEKDHA